MLKSRRPPPLQGGRELPSLSLSHWGRGVWPQLSLKATALIRGTAHSGQSLSHQCYRRNLGPFLHLRLLEARRGYMVGAKWGQAPRGNL